MDFLETNNIPVTEIVSRFLDLPDEILMENQAQLSCQYNGFG